MRPYPPDENSGQTPKDWIVGYEHPSPINCWQSPSVFETWYEGRYCLLSILNWAIVTHPNDAEEAITRARCIVERPYAGELNLTVGEYTYYLRRANDGRD